MALFLGVHDLKKNMGAGWEGYKKACVELGCRAVHAYSNDEKKVGYCVTEASSADEVRKAHDNANIPLEEVFEVVRSDIFKQTPPRTRTKFGSWLSRTEFILVLDAS